MVPVKNFENVKERLSTALTPAERQHLFRCMLVDVLNALSECPELEGTVLVTREPEATALAPCYGAKVLIERENLGHTAASTFAACRLAQVSGTSMLQLPGDLPLLAPPDITALVVQHAEQPAITLAPSRDGRGSNAVLCTPADVLPLHFGNDSFNLHMTESRNLGIEPAICERPGLALDIDTPEDLVFFFNAPSATTTYEYLYSSGIGARLSAQFS